VVEGHLRRPKSGWDIDDMGKKREKCDNLKDGTSGLHKELEHSKTEPGPVLV
jgi:hypothetical protein